MTKFIAVNGRLPQLSLSEMESVFGADRLAIFSAETTEIDGEVTESDYKRLGGVLKIAQVLTELPPDWPAIENYLKDSVVKHSDYVDGKLNLGISTYGIRIGPQKLQKTLLTLKKLLKSNGKSVRVILNKEPALSTAEVYHNKLTGKNGWELLIVSNGQKTLLAQTRYVQNIDSYVFRDRSRPKRDARVGMLPPKLAQTIINIASGDNNDLNSLLLLDPFCGTGVVLQEALLMGLNVYGTDKEPRMIEYSKANLEWLQQKFDTGNLKNHFEAADATKHTWTPAPDIVACETYLGPPLTSYISDQELAKMIGSVNKLHEDFLKNLAPQLAPGTRLCLAVPAWRRKNGYKHLPVLEKLSSIGYNWVKFELSDSRNLIYDRPDQFVARQLVTIIKA